MVLSSLYYPVLTWEGCSKIPHALQQVHLNSCHKTFILDSSPLEKGKKKKKSHPKKLLFFLTSWHRAAKLVFVYMKKKSFLRTVPETLSPTHGFKCWTSGTQLELLLSFNISVEHGSFALSAEGVNFMTGIKE